MGILALIVSTSIGLIHGIGHIGRRVRARRRERALVRLAELKADGAAIRIDGA